MQTEHRTAFSDALLPRSSLSLSLSSGSVEIADFVSIPCLALPNTGSKTTTGFCMRQDTFSRDVADTKDISCGMSCVSVAFEGEMSRSTVAGLGGPLLFSMYGQCNHIICIMFHFIMILKLLTLTYPIATAGLKSAHLTALCLIRSGNSKFKWSILKKKKNTNVNFSGGKSLF